MATKSSLPGLKDWTTYAGGTGAAPGKHSYGATDAAGRTYYIQPVATAQGRHRGYVLRFHPGTHGLWASISPTGQEVVLGSREGVGAAAAKYSDHLYGSPQQAVAAAKKFAAAAVAHAAPVEAMRGMRMSRMAIQDLTFEEFVQIARSLEAVAPVFRGFAANVSAGAAQVAPFLPVFTKGFQKHAAKLVSKGVWIPERLVSPPSALAPSPAELTPAQAEAIIRAQFPKAYAIFRETRASRRP